MANRRGIRWFCVWWAFSVCLLCSTVADASKRVYPRLNGPSESTGGVPSRNAGSLVTTNRLLHGQTILKDPRGPGRHMNLPAQQGSFFSIRGITINAQGMFRRNLPAIVMGGAIAGIGYGLDWIFDEADQQWKKDGDTEVPPINGTGWQSYSGSCPGVFPTAESACSNFATVCQGRSYYYTFERSNPDTLGCVGHDGENINGTYKNSVSQAVYTNGIDCPDGADYDPEKKMCIGGERTPITESDISQIEPEITGANPEFIQDILRNACNGSNAPDACFESLMDKTELSGPSTITTPSTTSTTTVTGPDGVAGTSTTTTNSTFNITYGPNYYQYTTTTNSTTTKPDGTTETTEETDAPPFGEDPREPEEEIQEAPSPCTGDNCSGPAYTDMYTPSEATKEGVLDEYIARATQVPLFQAVTGFFDVSVSASCPVWSAEVDFSVMGIGFDHSLLFDYHCQPWFTDYRPYAMAVFLVVGAFLAFRIGVL